MNFTVGIRHEDKYKMERRTPIIPKHVVDLVNRDGIQVYVQGSEKRIFSDTQFAESGAKIVNQMKDCPVIFGIKEIPVHALEAGKTYVFFSHVIKGQSYNMPMLKRMMDLKCNLIDYEKITDELNRRLIFFGRFAGLAGMIDSLWALGLRLNEFGFTTAFMGLKQAHKYASLEEAIKDISESGHEIASKGFHKDLLPFVIGFTGYGNVSNGAQEICNFLPVQEITPEELLRIRQRKNLANNIIYKVIFKEEHLSEPIDNKEFDLDHYYTHPHEYRDQFKKYMPHLTVLMNCMYWDERYPRIVTKDYIEKLYKLGNPKLTLIGDITCDIEGSIECTLKGADVEDPIFVYHPFRRDIQMGYKGEGLLMMTVDILPTELPRESSIAFSNAIYKYVKPIASAAYDVPFEELILPNPIKRAMILHKGMLTPEYEYISEYLSKKPDK